MKIVRNFLQINTHVTNRKQHTHDPKLILATLYKCSSGDSPRSLAFHMHKLLCTWYQSWTVSGITVSRRLSSHFALCIIQIMPQIHYEIYFCYFLVSFGGDFNGVEAVCMAYVFQLRFIHVCVCSCRSHKQSITSLLRACSFVGNSLCFIFQCIRKQYLMIFKLFCARFSVNKTSLNSQRRTRKSEICNVSAILEVKVR